MLKGKKDAKNNNRYVYGYNEHCFDRVWHIVFMLHYAGF
jgi:hypothetical protein